jgi:cold shock CspA family protein
MRTLLVAAASALFFGALVTELSTRLWPGNYFALLMASVLALFVSGLLNLRLVRPAAAAVAVAPDLAQEVTRPRPEAAPQRRSAEPQRQPASRGQGSSQSREQPRGERPRGPRAEGGERPPRPESARAAQSRAPEPEVPAGPREQGTVKWFNRTKGFGFVIRESGDEIFVHQRSIRAIGEGEERRRPALQDGQAVSFVVVVREKGPQAEDVVPVENS